MLIKIGSILLTDSGLWVGMDIAHSYGGVVLASGMASDEGLRQDSDDNNAS